MAIWNSYAYTHTHAHTDTQTHIGTNKLPSNSFSKKKKKKKTGPLGSANSWKCNWRPSATLSWSCVACLADCLPACPPACLPACPPACCKYQVLTPGWSHTLARHLTCAPARRVWQAQLRLQLAELKFRLLVWDFWISVCVCVSNLPKCRQGQPAPVPASQVHSIPLNCNPSPINLH